jgi:hypothetical protein
MSEKPDSEAGICIGNSGDNGCGFVGGLSGETCPQCGGMLLSERSIAIADKATEDWLKASQQTSGSPHPSRASKSA